MNKDGVYGDLRCYTKKDIPKMNMEVLCLDKVKYIIQNFYSIVDGKVS